MTGGRHSGFWSARVNLDLRIIVYRAGQNIVPCYVDSHDGAYRWAESSRLEANPSTCSIFYAAMELASRIIDLAPLRWLTVVA